MECVVFLPQIEVANLHVCAEFRVIVLVNERVMLKLKQKYQEVDRCLEDESEC